MSKNIEVLIVNAHTIQLNQDANKGDRIDLKSIQHIDSSLLNQKIDEQVNSRYQEMLEKEKKTWRFQQENAIQSALKEKEAKIIQLEEKMKLNEQKIKTEMESSYSMKVETLKHHVQLLEQERKDVLSQKKTEIELEVSKVERQLSEQISSHKSTIEQLKRDQVSLTERLDLKLENAVQKKEQELRTIINDQDKEISKLTLEKSSSNIKKMGEQLETWVNEEYQNHSLNGFETCLWEKDNQSVRLENESKGTKADYLFRVYANDDFVQEQLLTSVAIEIKSEDPNSVYKKKNSDHFDKLDKDRKKKHCEYALLVSELEWNSPNDAPVKKIQGYDKMYLVRPQYFIVFLNLVSAIALQYQSLVIDYNIARGKFKDAEDIKTQFNQMKSDILDRSIKYIISKAEEIYKSAEKIHDEAGKIKKASRIILDSHIQTIINKIEQFKIDQIIQKIDQLDNGQ